jgi:hypothetical protein
VVVLIAAIVVGTAFYIRNQWYLADDGGHVAIYRGERGEFAGISLSRHDQTTDLPTDQVTDSDRHWLHSGEVSGRSTIDAQLNSVRSDACDSWRAAHPVKPASAKHRKTLRRQPAPTPPPWCPASP